MYRISIHSIHDTYSLYHTFDRLRLGRIYMIVTFTLPHVFDTLSLDK